MSWFDTFLGATLGALTGLVAGIAGGPVGMIGGAIVGGVTGGLKGNEVDRAEKQADKQKAQLAFNAREQQQAHYRQAITALENVANQGVTLQAERIADLQKSLAEDPATKEKKHKPFMLVKDDQAQMKAVQVLSTIRSNPSYGKPYS